MAEGLLKGMGEGPNSELLYPIRLHIILAGEGGGWGCQISNFLSPLPHF